MRGTNQIFKIIRTTQEKKFPPHKPNFMGFLAKFVAHADICICRSGLNQGVMKKSTEKQHEMNSFASSCLLTTFQVFVSQKKPIQISQFCYYKRELKQKMADISVHHYFWHASTRQRLTNSFRYIESISGAL